VVHIGFEAFYESDVEIAFAAGSEMTVLDAFSFNKAYIRRSLVLPEGVERLEGHSLPTSCAGVMLPESLRSIAESTLYCKEFRSMQIYLPHGLPFDGIAKNAFNMDVGVSDICIYSEREITPEQVQEWGGVEAHYAGNGVVLIDGEDRTELSGRVFILPTPEKQGKTFLGWKNESGYIVGEYFIPKVDGQVLTAVYEDYSPIGTATSPIKLGAGDTYVFNLAIDQSVYFDVDCEGMGYSIRFELLKDDDTDEACEGSEGAAYETMLWFKDGPRLIFLAKSPWIECPEGEPYVFSMIRLKNSYGCMYSLKYKVEVVLA